MAAGTPEQRLMWFLRDLKTVYEEHHLALGHEDLQGAFIVVPWDHEHENWLLQARWGYPEGHQYHDRNEPD